MHIADLHIRSTLAESTRAVFDAFLGHVERVRPDAVVIVGDVFDNKINVKPSDIRLFRHLVAGVLRLRVDVIVVPGNHDCNANNPDDPDLIAPLAEDLFHDVTRGESADSPTPKLYYWSKTGVYENVHGCDWYVYSAKDRGVPRITSAGDRDRIALVHEPISQCKLPNGQRWNERTRLNADHLSELYTIAMLGDIHKKQFLRDNVAYSGSLVQQNISEHPLNHGYILWALEGDEPPRGEFHRVENPFGSMIKIVARRDAIVERKRGVKRAMRVDVDCYDCTPEFIRRLDATIREEYGVAPYRFRNFLSSQASLAQTTATPLAVSTVNGNDEKCDECSKLGEAGGTCEACSARRACEKCRKCEQHDVARDKCGACRVCESHAPDILEQWIARQDWITENQAVLLRKTHARYTRGGQGGADDDATCGKTFRLLYLEWRNMMCYGDDRLNYIDFTRFKRNAKIGVFARNKFGKSSVLDVLTFTLFNVYERTRNKMDIVNKHSRHFSCRAVIRHNDQVYEISRWGTPENNSHKVTRDGTVITGASIPDTYRMLARVTGRYDDFVNVTAQMQDTPPYTGFERASDREYLYRTIGWREIPDLRETVKRRIAELRGERRALGKRPAAPTLSDEDMQVLEQQVEADRDVDDRVEAACRALGGIETDAGTDDDAPARVYTDEEIRRIESEFVSSARFASRSHLPGDTRDKLEREMVDTHNADAVVAAGVRLGFTANPLRKPVSDDEMRRMELEAHEARLACVGVARPVVLIGADKLADPDEIRRTNAIDPNAALPAAVKRDLRIEILDDAPPRFTAQDVEQMNIAAAHMRVPCPDAVDVHMPGDTVESLQRAIEDETPLVAALECARGVAAARAALQFNDSCGACTENRQLAAQSNVDACAARLAQTQTRNSDARRRLASLQFARYRDAIEDASNAELYVCDREAARKRRDAYIAQHNAAVEKLVATAIAVAKYRRLDAAELDVKRAREARTDFAVLVRRVESRNESLRERIASAEYYNILDAYNDTRRFLRHRERERNRDAVAAYHALKQQQREHRERVTQLERERAARDAVELYDRKLDRVETRMLGLTLYQKAIDLDTGFPALLIETRKRRLNEIVQETMDMVTDGDTVVFDDRGGTTINGVPVAAASGFQKMLVNIAMRIAIERLSTAAHLHNTLIIDEGAFSACDPEHLQRVVDIVPRLPIRLILVTHMDALAAAMTDAIHITEPGRLRYGDRIDQTGAAITGTDAPETLETPDVSESDAARQAVLDALRCSKCNLQFTTPKRLEAHLKSQRHARAAPQRPRKKA